MDKHTYPLDPQMKSEVYYFFMKEALDVLFNKATETPSRISFATDVIHAQVNQNELSRAVATNPTIGAKIVADDMSYVDDLEYVVSTSYVSGTYEVPLFTIFAEAKYPPT